MKNVILIFVCLYSSFLFSQENRGFKQPYISFETCNNSENKQECFDTLIISKMLETAKNDILAYKEKYPNSGNLSLHVSFIIDENGRPIDESIRTTKNEISDINKKLDSMVKTLPDIIPLRNENNHKILSFYQLFIDVAVNDKNELVLVEKTNEPKEFSEDSCCTAPIYEGCEGTSNKELKQCFSNNVSKIIGSKFNTKKAFKGFKKEGTFYTYILFNIDKKGDVNDVHVFGPTKNITDEAVRALGKIKRLEPGKKNGESIIVPFVLPIRLNI